MQTPNSHGEKLSRTQVVLKVWLMSQIFKGTSIPSFSPAFPLWNFALLPIKGFGMGYSKHSMWKAMPLKLGMDVLINKENSLAVTQVPGDREFIDHMFRKFYCKEETLYLEYLYILPCIYPKWASFLSSNTIHTLLYLLHLLPLWGQRLNDYWHLCGLAVSVEFKVHDTRYKQC